MRRLILVLAVVMLGAVSAAPGAGAMGVDGRAMGLTTLASLADGGSLTSKNGELVFDDFEVTATGSVFSDLDAYKVITLVDGFMIIGPFASTRGNDGELRIEYTVTASSPITEATLHFNGVAHGEDSSASVVETFEPLDIELMVYLKGGSDGDRQDSVNLDGFLQLRVTKDIRVDSDGSKSFSRISRIVQRIETAPEPATLLLLGSALVGVAVARRRRA